MREHQGLILLLHWVGFPPQLRLFSDIWTFLFQSEVTTQPGKGGTVRECEETTGGVAIRGCSVWGLASSGGVSGDTLPL